MTDDSATTDHRVPRPGRWIPVAAVIVIALGLVGGAASGLIPLPGGTRALEAPRFVEEALAAGVQHRYDGEFAYFVGGGVAVFDCDDDARLDLYVAGGAEPAALFRNESAPGGALSFGRVPHPATDLDAVVGAYPLDLDGDRHTDLVVLRVGGKEILRGLGGCRFETATDALRIDRGDEWTTAFSATWETPDATLPTLAFGHYVRLDAQGRATFECPANDLVRPASDGAGYAPSVDLAPGWCPLSMLFSDWDRSGRRDLRISNDRHYYRDGDEQLWRIAQGEAPRRYTPDDGWRPLRIWGMGIASQDVTGDGYPEVYLTSQGDNKLQTLADDASRPTYEDIALRRGVTAHRPYTGGDILPSTAWHPEFEDVNNDGFLDLLVTKGNVEAELELAKDDPTDLLMGRPDGTFVQGAIEAGIVDMARARGAALVDLNADGLLDLVKVVRRRNVQLWRNVGSGTADAPEPMGHWIAVAPEGDGANRHAVGAWVAVRVGETVTEREVVVGGGHVSGQLAPIHVGLGTATEAEVRLTWPDGEVGPWMRVGADRVVRVVRGAAAPGAALP